MTVEVVNLQGGTGGGDPNLFEDTFLGGDQPFVMGTEWEVVLDPNGTEANSGAQYAGFYNRIVTGLQVGNNLAGQFVPRAFCIPRPLSWSRVRSQSQFAEYEIITDDSAGGALTRFGPMCLCNPNLGTTYWCILVVEAPFRLVINRWAAFAGTDLANTGLNAFAFGDTISLTADIVSAGAQVDLEVFVNGVSTLSVSDATASRLTDGMPGIFTNGASAAREQVMRDFRGGALSRF